MKRKINIFLVLLIALVVQIGFAQERPVSGVVTDEETDAPINGVSVLLKGTQTKTQTDLEGKFTINASHNSILVLSSDELETQEVIADTAYIRVVMRKEITEMEEVVVVGYGTQKRKEITGAVGVIKGKELENLVSPNFESQFAGRTTGVEVITQSGKLGAAPVFRIRGISSISSGTYPLIVVDGMPIVTGEVGGLGGLASTNGLADINPNDIESYEFLKDGAATAIYGSRAANGVVLITTKSGKKGTMKTSFNTSVGIANAAKKYDLLQTPDFLTISNEKRSNRNMKDWAVGSEYNTDWQKAILNENPVQINSSLSLSGGSDKAKYYGSLGLSDMTGIALANSLKRYTVRTNVEGNVTKWLTAGTNLGVTKSEYQGLNTETTALSGNIFAAAREAPNTPIYDPSNPTGYNINLKGNTVGKWENLADIGDKIPNIVYVLNNNKHTSDVTRILLNTFANAKITQGLNFRIQGSFDNSITKGLLYWNPIHGDGNGYNGYIYNDNTEYFRWNWQNILTYSKIFAEKHSVALTGVAEYQKERYQNYFGSGMDILNEFYNQGLVTDSYAIKDSGGGMFENGIISFVGRFNYDFSKKYFLQATLRRDGISKLSSSTRWNTFPSISAGWAISDEEFMKPLETTLYLSLLKIRASYSVVGNTDIGNYPYVGYTGSAPYNDLNGIAYAQFGNDKLKWESSSKKDIGVEIALFDNKFNFTFDYFRNDVDQLILAAPVPPSLGIPKNTINKNVGALYNKGFEFSASYKMTKEDFAWNISANLSLIENKVTKLYDSQDILGTYTIIREGESLRALYGFRYYGVNKANGNPVYYKADNSLVEGDPTTGNYTVFDPANPGVKGAASSLDASKDKTILGNSAPTYYGGVNNSFTYKGIDLGFLFRFSGGNKIFNETRRELVSQNFVNNGTEILGRWQSPENPGDGWTPKLYASTNTFTNLSGHVSSRFVEDGSFISLENITLGYSFPRLITSKIKVDLLRLYVLAQGVAMFTNYKGLNPEMQVGSGIDYNGTPIQRTISAGININL